MKLIKWIVILSILFIFTPITWKYIRNKGRLNQQKAVETTNTVVIPQPSNNTPPSIPTTVDNPKKSSVEIERDDFKSNDWEFMDTDSQGYKRYCSKRTDITTEWFNISIYDYVFQQDTDLYVEFQVRDEIIRLRISANHDDIFLVDQDKETKISLDEFNKISKKSKNIRFIPTEYDGDMGKIVIKRK